MGAYLVEDHVNRQLVERRAARRHRFAEEYPVVGGTASRDTGRSRDPEPIGARLLDVVRWLARRVVVLRGQRS